jgi:hypothetical protein
MYPARTTNNYAAILINHLGGVKPIPALGKGWARENDTICQERFE